MDARDARDRRVEMLRTLVLGLAAVATAWGAFQGQRWRGEQAVETRRSIAALIESSEAATRAGQLTMIDVGTFTQWVDATATGETELADFYQQRFRAEFQPAFEAWLATQPLTDPDAPPTPFALPEYRLAETEKSERLNREAVERSAAAGRANRHADEYLLATVLFATALFFAGISAKPESRLQGEILLGLGGLAFLGAALWLATLPTSFGR